jgi:hypothetical protein
MQDRPILMPGKRVLLTPARSFRSRRLWNSLLLAFARLLVHCPRTRRTCRPPFEDSACIGSPTAHARSSNVRRRYS